jgi:hypothetical protein
MVALAVTQEHVQKKGNQKMKMWRILTMAGVLVIVTAPLLTRFTTWIAAATRTVLFALAPPVAVALVLVLDVNWRARLKSHILPRNRAEELTTAA